MTREKWEDMWSKEINKEVIKCQTWTIDEIGGSVWLIGDIRYQKQRPAIWLESIQIEMKIVKLSE